MTSTFEATVNSSLCRGISHLHADGEMFDLAVTVSEESFSCHSLVLAAVSGYFQDLFRRQPRKEFVTVKDPDVSPRAFFLLLEMLYKKTDPLQNSGTAMEMMKAAVFLQIEFLQEHCEDFLRRELSSEVCLETWQFADKYGLKNLQSDAKFLASRHFEEVIKTSSFLDLPFSFLLALLSCDDLQVSSEDMLCKAVLKWVDDNVDGSTDHLPILLPLINFTNMSEDYLQRLRRNQRHKKELEDYIEEAVSVELESAKRLNSLEKSRLLARQERRVPDTAAMMVTVGGVDENSETLTTVKACPFPEESAGTDDTEAESPADTARDLVDIPQCPGIDFASCVWRNELYVSGGAAAPWQFVVYNAGVDEWKELPDLQQGLAKHAMAALGWRVYVLGGEVRDEEGKTKPTSLVHIFDISTETWNDDGYELPVAVSDVTAALLGHKIYVFGGKDADDNPTTLVQCVDTLTGSAFQTGRLPSPTSGARAVADSGFVLLVRPEGDILRLREESCCHTDRAQRQQANGDAESAYGSVTGSQELAANTADVDHAASGDGDAATTEATAEPKRPAVVLENVSGVSSRRHFSVCTHAGKLVVCGGQDETGAWNRNVEVLDLATGTVSQCTQQTLTGHATARFGIHALLLPKATDTVVFRHTFRLDALEKVDRISSHRVRMNAFEWYLAFQTETTDGSDFLAVYLIKEKARLKGNWEVGVKCIMWLVPKRAEVKGISKDFVHIFKGSDAPGWGYPEFISFSELKDPAKGYVSLGGEVTVEATVTITAKPTLEAPPPEGD